MGAFEARLPELPEAEAQGEIAVIYGELRAFARVPFVALIYRHLATRPGVLPWVWRALRPGFASGALTDAASRIAEAARLPTITPLRAAEWRMAGLLAADRVGIETVLEAYDRANPINLLVVRLIDRLLAGGVPPIRTASAGDREDRAYRPVRSTIPSLPPLLPASAIPAEISAELARLSRFAQPEAGAVTPSLYRHLAHWPGYLALLPDRLEPAFLQGAISDAVRAYRQAADAEASGLWPMAHEALGERAAAIPPGMDGVSSTLEAFAALIPEMIAVGRLARAMLPREPL